MVRTLKVGDVIIVADQAKPDEYRIALIEPPLKEESRMFFLRYYEAPSRSWLEAINRRKIKWSEIMGVLPAGVDLDSVFAGIDKAIARRKAMSGVVLEEYHEAIRQLAHKPIEVGPS